MRGSRRGAWERLLEVKSDQQRDQAAFKRGAAVWSSPNLVRERVALLQFAIIA